MKPEEIKKEDMEKLLRLKEEAHADLAKAIRILAEAAEACKKAGKKWGTEWDLSFDKDDMKKLHFREEGS